MCDVVCEYEATGPERSFLNVSADAVAASDRRFGGVHRFTADVISSEPEKHQRNLK